MYAIYRHCNKLTLSARREMFSHASLHGSDRPHLISCWTVSSPCGRSYQTGRHGEQQTGVTGDCQSLAANHAMGDRITALCVRSRCRKAPSFLSIVTSPPPSRKTATEAGGPSVSAHSFGILIEVTAMDLRATGGAILSNKVEKEQTHTLSLEVV